MKYIEKNINMFIKYAIININNKKIVVRNKKRDDVTKQSSQIK